MKKNELNKNVILNEDAVKNIHCDEITAVINSNDSPKAMMNKLDDYHGSDIAEVISTFSVLNRRKFYRVCSLEMLAEIFEYLDEKQAGEYLREMDIHKASELISELDTDTAVNILSETDKDRRSLIIDAVAPDVRSELKLIASFDEEEIGSRMTTNCIIIDEDMTVKQAMNALVSQARKNDNISTLFVVDENKVFSGAIDLKDLITADSEVELESITATSFPYVYANEQTADCIEKLKDYSEYIIPVLDDSNRLLGVITAQNIIEASDDEMGEDYAKLGGLSAEEDLNEPVLQSVKKRLPWLLVLLGLGMAGNVGTQSLAVTIRVLTDGGLTAKQKLHLVSKEMRVGLLNGTLIGMLSLIAVGLYIFFFKGKGLVYSFAMSGCIGISLILAIIVSSAVGTLTPLFFKKIKIDPAVASGPMITTLNDLVAVVAYYGTSWIFLLNVLKLG